MSEARALSGLEQLQRAAKSSGAGPSTIGKTLNFRLVGAELGGVSIEGEPTEAFLNPLGFIHGGWALTLIDSATALAAHTTLAPGVGYTSLETKANFVRAITPQTGVVRAEGRVVAQGRTIITSEARLTDKSGKLLAHGTATIMALYPKEAA